MLLCIVSVVLEITNYEQVNTCNCVSRREDETGSGGGARRNEHRVGIIVERITQCIFMYRCIASTLYNCFSEHSPCITN